MSKHVERFAGVTVTVTDNSKEILEALEIAKRRALESIGKKAEKFAKKDPNMPVDTGRARNSITWATKEREGQSYSYKAKNKNGETVTHTDSIGGGADDDAVYLGSNVEYFPQIENGGIHMSARHVLQNAATGHSGVYKRLVKDSLEDA